MADPSLGAQVYLCPRCLIAHGLPGICANCSIEVIACQVGDLDDPRRKPLMTRVGQIKTRAPRWWLHHTVPRLMEIADRR